MKLWDEFVELQEKELGKEVAEKWLYTLKIINFDACNIYLEALNPLHVHWFEEHLRQKASLLVNANFRKVKVHVKAKGSLLSQKGKQLESPSLPSFTLQSDLLDPYALLENFIPTEKNTIPYKVISEMMEGKIEESAFNPLYLYGKTGTGKTHLLMGIAHHLKNLGKNVVYVRAVTFTEHFVQAIRIGKMGEFRDSYRKADVLLIDDVHIFARRAASQEELFHTFNNLHGEKKQIILTSNTAPQNLIEIEPRLVSRFEWGISLHLEKPTPEELRLILKQRAGILSFPLTDELSDFLMESFKSIKLLQKALETLILRSHLEKDTFINIKKAEVYLEKILAEEKKNAITPEKILQSVSSFYGVRVSEITGKSQSQECSLPRQMTMYLCREELNMPFLKIGHIFSRDHSTVMTAIKQITKKIEMGDSTTIANLETLTRSLESIPKDP